MLPPAIVKFRIRQYGVRHALVKLDVSYIEFFVLMVFVILLCVESDHEG